MPLCPIGQPIKLKKDYLFFGMLNLMSLQESEPRKVFVDFVEIIAFKHIKIGFFSKRVKEREFRINLPEVLWSKVLRTCSNKFLLGIGPNIKILI